MSSKVSCWLLLCLTILLAAFLVQSSEGATFRTFRTRHINNPKTGAPNNNAYCNRMMQQRGMTRRICKPTNTFIHAPTGRIQAICRGQGTPAGRNYFDSRNSFSLTTCRGGGRPPNCRYRGTSQTRRIRVACVRRQPVHFGRVL